MRSFTSHTGLPTDARGASAAIGNFDGVHLGHLAVIGLARHAAEQLGAPLGVVTFDPHPREFFHPETPPFRLMTPAAKAHRLDKIGVDLLFSLPFDTALSQLDADAFARDVLVAGLGLRHVVVGADFCFGRGRKGTAADLVAMGAAHGFGVTVADLQSFETGDPVSSTRIRAALSDGKPREACAMLGHWHRVEGPVLHGEKRGRTLGYPTANMSIDGLHPPRFGVYAVQVDVLTGPHAGRYGGVASLGVRPMFGVNTANLETFVFDFAGDLYGAEISVALIDFLRPELKFGGVEALVTQMNDDSARARAILAAL
jgi:riboflavin kinase/FMN adenylyltransferase